MAGADGPNPGETALPDGSVGPRRVAVVTGTRAEYGLLRPVMRAIAASPALELQVIVTGVHLLPEVNTVTEVEQAFPIAARVPMQIPDDVPGRQADVAALARGIAGLNEAFHHLDPWVVLVLGDRIEAFAAASAASIGGRLVAHLHGGDRAEGVADDSMRHAITKLSHLHFAASARSAERILRMGERAETVWTVGSSSLDELPQFPPLDDDAIRRFGADPARPFAVVAHHPAGGSDLEECSTMLAILQGAASVMGDPGQVLVIAPNRDPGQAGIARAIRTEVLIQHVPRARFIGLLRRAALLVGNSSAGLIEAAALGVPVVNVGPRQAGRERGSHVIDVGEGEPVTASGVADACRRAVDGLPGAVPPPRVAEMPLLPTPFGDGRTAMEVAALLAEAVGRPPALRKCIAW